MTTPDPTACPALANGEPQPLLQGDGPGEPDGHGVDTGSGLLDVHAVAPKAGDVAGKTLGPDVELAHARAGARKDERAVALLGRHEGDETLVGGVRGDGPGLGEMRAVRVGVLPMISTFCPGTATPRSTTNVPGPRDPRSSPTHGTTPAP
ncbi:hypothetical protein [Streptomyces abikoensis]|uniref:hypothetical protein n=1 Tax=Streptomyces abikoensis TaxID=97398 RepID=UPI00167C2810|nr:hypothetical protein [Streptomyces abikoensis]GGP39881.1 hypothetical protein GCM10010214_11530 [Streptomyces abikoensis]